MGLNYISIIGEALGNPEKRHTMEGLPVASFNILLASPDGEPHSLKVSLSKKLIDRCINEVHNGDQVLIEGKLYSKVVENRYGYKQKVPYIQASNFVVVKQRSTISQVTLNDSPEPVDEEEIPF